MSDFRQSVLVDSKSNALTAVNLVLADQRHCHRRRGCQLLLAKVRMPIGRIGIFYFDNTIVSNIYHTVIKLSVVVSCYHWIYIRIK